MFELQDCMAFLTSKAAKAMAAELENRFAPYHISRAQFFVLYYVDLNTKLTQTELADCMGLKTPSVARLLDRMEGEKLVQRVHVKSDRRVNFVKLTKKGKEMIDSLYPIAEEFKQTAISGISQEDLELYQQVLNKMQVNLNIEVNE